MVSTNNISEIYVDLGDLHWYHIEYQDSSDHLYLYNGYKSAEVYCDSNIVTVNGTNLMYYNAMIQTDETKSISLAFLAMVFSQICDTTADAILLWMPYYPDNYVKGVVSLPDGVVAPKNGVKVTVGVYEYLTDSSQDTEKVYPSVGYPGTTWYDYNYFEREKLILEEQIVTIEEGKNSVSYFLSSGNSFGIHSYVYYKVDDNGYQEEETVPFSYKKEELYNFCIGENKCSINGKIYLLGEARKDVDFCLVADGTKEYRLYGTIPAGENIFEYSINVATEDIYKLQLLFLEKTYVRTSYGSVLVEDSDVAGIDLYCEPSSKIKVKVSLPDGTVRNEDTTGYLFLQSAVKPYFYLDDCSFTIPAGQTDVQVELTDDRGFDDFYVFYEFKESADGLYDFGYYNSNGTTIALPDMESIWSGKDIEIELMKAKEIYADIVLPTGQTAGSYLDARIQLVSAKETKPLMEVNACRSSEELDEVLQKYSAYFDLSQYQKLDEEQKDYVLVRLRDYTYYSREEVQYRLDKLVKKALVSSGGSFAVDTTEQDGEKEAVNVLSLYSLEENVAETYDESMQGGAVLYQTKATPVITTEEKSFRLIQKGMDRANVCIKLPLNDDSFVLKISNISDESYYPDIYYHAEKGSTVFFQNAGLLDEGLDKIEVCLMPANTISGQVTNLTDYQKLEILAVYQDELPLLKEYTESNFVVFMSEFDDNGNYVIYTPEELSYFTVMLLGEKENLYYHPDGNVNTLKGAEVINSALNPDQVNFRYNYYDPVLPLQLNIRENNDGWVWVEAENTSDYEKKNVNLYLAMYDERGKLTHRYSKVIPSILPNEMESSYFGVAPYDIEDASTVKVFAWSDGVKPYSNTVSIKENGIGQEQNTAKLWMKSGCSTITAYGDIIKTDAVPMMMNNALMSTIRPLAEGFGLSAFWDEQSHTVTLKDATNTLTMELYNKTATYNDEPFELSNAVSMYQDKVYVPVADIAKKFGYDTEFYYDTCELFVFYGAIEELVEDAKKRTYIPQYLVEKDGYAQLTRYDVAQLLVPLCEAVLAEKMKVTGVSSYPDTDDVNILKLSDAGIMEGYDDGAFYPDRTVTNAEFIKMLFSALTYVEETVPKDLEEVEYFYNHVHIPEWVREPVYRMKVYGALSGVYNQIFYATGKITVRQAIAVVTNAFHQAYDMMFPDIDPASGYKEAAIRLYRLEIMMGYEDGTFRPDGQVMRSEFATLITRMLGVDQETVKTYDGTFDDVEKNHWAKHYIGYCVEHGIMELENNCFRPDDPITNKEAIWGLMRALGYQELDSFADVYDRAEEIGLLHKLEDINTDKYSKRIETAQMIYNALEQH
ncbi:MAG: S-layer homology domain-containing protein [Clostridia bacterium]|nr:S-layer homology domain-containing protein [Clostridia bacterium]